MSDDITTTWEVRMAFINYFREEPCCDEHALWDYEGAFDCWLASVKAEAWDEGFEAGQDEADGHQASRQWNVPHTCITNPYYEETE